MLRARVLIADDHLLSRKGIISLLRAAPELEVVGEAGDGREALAQARELLPDLILMDISMPGLNGLEATRRIKAELPAVRVVILTVSGDVQDFCEAMKAGAQGYLRKDMEPEVWVEYLRHVLQGEARIPRSLAARVLRDLAVEEAPDPRAAGVTDREREVLELVASGLSNREIAARLVIAETTVKNHLRHILEKLRVRNRVELAAYAFEQGLVRPRLRPPR